MPVALGIDTGGTYTDAILVDHASGAILAGTKDLTTRHDLSIGITGAIKAVFAQAAEKAPSPSAIDLVGLSTTLATNAIVEGQGTPVCLLLVGYDPRLIQQHGFERDLVTRDVIYVRGGHDGLGDEAEPLDEAAVRAAVIERRDQVEAFAVSAYFSVRNPAHELRVRQIVEELTGTPDSLPLPVTCGHELTSRLDSVRRATTVTLNARLIPLLRELITTVRSSLDEMGISAPLMIVKGDGSLVQSEWAMRRPIETILSGPAASVVGAWHLAGRQDGWVVDVGGTTTDIAVLRDGLPRLNPEGARIGRWRTMIETIDVHTAGLGGDSHIRFDPGYSQLSIGPRRAVPLCQLAHRHPEVVAELRRQLAAREHLGISGQFTQAQRRAGAALAPREQEILDHLDSLPRSFIWLAENLSGGLLTIRQLEQLETRQVVQRAGFTPTDALHVLGRFCRWNAEASRLGAELLAIQLGTSVEAFCEQVVARFSSRLSAEFVSKALGDEGSPPDWEEEPAATALLDRALDDVADSALECRLTLRQPIVAVGAPVQAYMPRAAEQLHTGLVIPDHAEVANALGAVVNGVVQRLRVLVRPNDLRFRFYLPEGVQDFLDINSGIAHAQKVASAHLQTLARQAGAEQTEVQMSRQNHMVPDGYGAGGEIFVEAELIFTAVGAPGLKPGSGPRSDDPSLAPSTMQNG